MQTFKDLKKDSEILTAEIRIPKIIGHFFFWNYVPADHIFEALEEMTGLPAETKQVWKQEMRSFIDSLESGVFTFASFSDPWAIDYMLGYITYKDYRQFSEIDAVQAMEIFPDLIEEGQSAESLALVLADMIEVMTRIEPFIRSLPSSVRTGEPYTTAEGLIAMEQIFTTSSGLDS